MKENGPCLLAAILRPNEALVLVFYTCSKSVIIHLSPTTDLILEAWPTV